MKKSMLLIPVIAVVLLLTMTQCKKNYKCGMRVVCYYSTTGLDTGEVFPEAVLDIYPGAVAPGRTIYQAIESGRVGITGADGSYEYTYPYEALLNITATYSDTTEHIDYRGTAQIKLQEGETVEKAILMVPDI